MTIIKIPIASDIAELFENSSPEDRRKVSLMISVLIRELAANDPAPLAQLMDEVSLEAQARGLTPEILETLLNDDE